MPHLGHHALNGVCVFALGVLLVSDVKGRNNARSDQQSLHEILRGIRPLIVGFPPVAAMILIGQARLSFAADGWVAPWAFEAVCGRVADSSSISAHQLADFIGAEAHQSLSAMAEIVLRAVFDVFKSGSSSELRSPAANAFAEIAARKGSLTHFDGAWRAKRLHPAQVASDYSERALRYPLTAQSMQPVYQFALRGWLFRPQSHPRIGGNVA
jgi:hypothetical protein